MLVKYIEEKKDLWEQFLDTCIYAYNTSYHESTKFTPYELMFGRKAVLPIDIDMRTSDPAQVLKEFHDCDELSPSAVDERSTKRCQILEVARANIASAQAKQKEQYDRKHCGSGNQYIMHYHSTSPH